MLGREIALPIIGAPTGLTGLTAPRRRGRDRARRARRRHDLHAVDAVLALDRGGRAARARAEVVPALRDDRPRRSSTTCSRAPRRAGYEALVLTVDVAGRGRARARRAQRLLRPAAAHAARAAPGRHRTRAGRAGFVASPRMTPGNILGCGGRRGASARRVRQPPVRPDGHLGRPRDLREHWNGPAGDQGHHARRRRGALPSSTASTRSSSPTTAAASSTTRSATIEALPAIAEAVGGRAEIYLDSGIRRGTDIIKALALGARAVLIGRPLVYGLGAAGEAGARRAFAMLAASSRPRSRWPATRGWPTSGPRDAV